MDQWESLTWKTAEISQSLCMPEPAAESVKIYGVALRWLSGIPHREEVHPLSEHHPRGISVEAHSAVRYLHHRAVQRERQGELFSANSCPPGEQ